MQESIWSATLGSFRDRLAGPESLPASVTTAAVTASFALALLVKILEMNSTRKGFTGDPRRIAELIEGARHEMTLQTQAADEDVDAFQSYMNSRGMPKATGEERSERDRAMVAAARRAVEVPMDAARSAVRGLEICAGAVDIVHWFVVADIGGAAALLAGAVRAIAVSIDSNLKQLRGEAHLYTRITAERRVLEDRAAQLMEATLKQALLTIAAPGAAGMKNAVC